MKAFKDIRNYFLRGIAALLPTTLTVWFFVQFYLFIQNNVSRHVNYLIVRGIVLAGSEHTEQQLVNFWVNGRGQAAGFIIIFLVVCFLGAFLASVVGRTIWRYFENLFTRAPIIRSVYPSVKQITDSVFSQKSVAFKKVVAVQYPRKGMWAIGMMTGPGIRELASSATEDHVSIFMPSSPTPFTGYVVIVKREDVVELTMSVEEALRFTVSGGVITPSKWKDMESDGEVS